MKRDCKILQLTLGLVLVMLLWVKPAGADADTPTLTEQVASAIVAFKHSDIPPEAIGKAEELIRDSMAVAVGSHGVETLKVMEAVLEVDGGDNLILHSGSKGKLFEAVYLNTLSANMLDFDDAHPQLGHPGATIVQPALVLARQYGKSYEELVEAVVAGYEFNIRWAKAAFDYPDKMMGPWSITLLQAFGTVVTAGKLLDLDATELARAFYFGAANMPLPVAQKMGLNPGQTMNGLKNNYGQAAQNMVLAVLTAKNSVYADPAVLDGDQGLWRMMGSKAFHEEKLLEEIGSRWDILEMQFKPYASCRWSHAAVDGFYQLMPEFEQDQVSKVDVYTFKAAYDAVSGRNPTDMFSLQFSVPHVFGMAMLGESLIYIEESSITNEEVIAFSEKVEVHFDQEYEDLFKTGKLPAKVVVTLSDGQVLEREVLAMKGELENPIPRDELDNKIKILIDSSPHENVKSYARELIAAPSSN